MDVPWIMEKAEFEADAVWALRKTRGLLDSAERVKLVALVRRAPRLVKAKVRHLDGDLAGLEEFVSSSHLLALWKDWPKILKDEEREGQLIEHVDASSGMNRVVADAAATVLYAMAKNLHVEDLRGFTRHLDLEALDHVEDRAHLEARPWRSAPNFKDRNGFLWVRNDDLVRLTIAFAAAEPHTVQTYLDLEEEKLRARGFVPGDRWWHEYLLKQQPAWSIARQWAAAGGRRDLEQEIERLRSLVHDAVATRRKAGEERSALRLERALHRRG